MKKFGGAYPISLKKVWVELMGLAAGPVSSPLLPLINEERTNLLACWSICVHWTKR